MDFDFVTLNNITIDRSALYDIRGNYIVQTTYNDHNGFILGEQGIQKLLKASCPDAFHDSQARNPPPRCLPGTRVEVLKEVFDWLALSDKRILWISGPAGAGKSAIAQTVAEACANDSTLAGSFMFLRGAQGRHTAERLTPSITYQIVTKMPHKRTEIGNIVINDPSIFSKPQRTQIQKLIIPMFTTLPNNAGIEDENLHLQKKGPSLIIIDGLDECQGENDQSDIVESIGELVTTIGVPLSCIIVSRPEPPIEDSFGGLGHVAQHISLGSSCNTSEAKKDIYTYLRHEFDLIYQRHKFIMEQYWPTDEVISELVRRSGGAFVYASTVLKYVDDHDFHPAERLEEVFGDVPGSTPFADLDSLYRHIMGTYKNTTLLTRVLTIVSCCEVTPPSWLSPGNIEALLHLRKGTVSIFLRRMCSILDTQRMSFYHKSFTDFVHDKERAREYFINMKQGHSSVAQSLLQYISSSPTEDSPLLEYATHQWSFHCENSGGWDENPQLLKEISKTLDFYEDQKSSAFTSCVSYSTRNILQWFEPTKPGPYPSDIQYRLFKRFWRDHIPLYCTIHMFTFYEEVDLGELLDYRLTYNNLLAAYWPRAKQDSGFFSEDPSRFWRSVISITSDNYSPEVGTQARLHGMIVYALVMRLLQEPEISEQYSFNFVESHIEVVNRCLEIFSTDYSSYKREPQEYSYARKYWTRHLSHVPHGNFRILKSLKEFDYSGLSHELAADDVRIVKTWIESSENSPQAFFH